MSGPSPAAPAPTWLGRTADAIIARIGVLPTTQLRFLVSLSLVVATGAAYIVLAIKVAIFGLHVTTNTLAQVATSDRWEPSATWLGFLLALLGLDTAQFYAKRTTDSSYVAAKQPITSAASTTTVSAITEVKTGKDG